MEDLEIIREFLIESSENLARLDQEMIELERQPKDAELLASIFRTIHTIKGTCGFLGFGTLESITHIAENILSRVRSGEKELTPEIVTLILSTVDAVRKVLAVIEETGTEGTEPFEELRHNLQAVCDGLSTGSDSGNASSADAYMHEAVSQTDAPCPAEVVSVADVPVSEPSDDKDITFAEQGRSPSTKTSSAADSTIRVDVGLLDKLMTLVGELVLARNQILQVASQEDAALHATSQRLNLITSELQENVMRTRMQPIGVVWNKLPRVVRDLAASCGKQIDLEMDGADTEIDKTIIEAIKDPLTHIVRNSCDHGLEETDARLRKGKSATGTLLLRAFHEGGHVNIEVSDDGAGIDTERVKRKAVQKGLLRSEQLDSLSERDAINLVFLPGFSTAEKVTNISGRGVGMDVVRTNIEKIGGSIELTSTPDTGTTVKIKIPLTLAIIPGLVIDSGGERFVIPQVSLLELVRLEGDARRRSIENVYGTAVYRRRGQLLPLAYLNEMLKLPSAQDHSDVINIVILQAENRQFGLVVDGISDTQEIVVKPLGKQLKGTPCYAGATIMGDGKVALILDVAGIAQLSGVLDRGPRREMAQPRQDKETASDTVQAFLLFKAGEFERLSVPLRLVARLEEVSPSRIEHAADRLVVQYRGSILPLIPLAECLHSSSAPREDGVPLQVVVVSNGVRSIGLVVDEIVDIIEDKISTVAKTARAGLLGSAVIGGRMTDVIDLHGIVQAVDPDWFEAQPNKKDSTVLLTDSSAFERGILRSALEMAGFRVLEAGGSDEAFALLSRMRVDAVLLALDVPPEERERILSSLRSNECLSALPVLALASSSQQLRTTQDEPRMGGSYLRSDRDEMVRSLEKLINAVEERACTPTFSGGR